MPQDQWVFSALTTKGSSDDELRRTPLLWSDGAWAHSLQEGHQLLNPLGDLDLPRLMRTGDLPVLQSPGFRLTCKPSAGHLSMSQPNPCSPWMQCWLLGPSPRVDGDWMGKDRVGGQSSVTKVLWMQRQWWDPAETAATLGFELKRMEGSRDKCDRMSWRHWWEGTARLGVVPVEGIWTGTPARKGGMAGSTGTEKAERGTGNEEPNREGNRTNTKEKGNTEMLFIKFVLPTLCSEWIRALRGKHCVAT